MTAANSLSLLPFVLGMLFGFDEEDCNLRGSINIGCRRPISRYSGGVFDADIDSCYLAKLARPVFNQDATLVQVQGEVDLFSEFLGPEQS